MNIQDSTALVTGANRGIGKAFAPALLARGAAKVYAAVRDVATVTGIELRRQGTQVVAVQAGPVDTDMSAAIGLECEFLAMTGAGTTGT